MQKIMWSQLKGNPKKFDDISDTLVHESVVRNLQNKAKNVNNIYTVEKGEKVEYNSLIHSRNMGDEFISKKRYKKRDNQTDKRRKTITKEKQYTEQYNDLLLDNLLKQYYSTKSPHLIISGKWFYRIRKNIIMLKSIREVNIGKDRHVYYDIERFGDNVRYIQKGNVCILNPSSTKNNTIYIIVRL